jgi:peptide-methionine (S)-S-oxide reductase
MRLAATFAATLLVAAAAVQLLTTPIQADDTPPPKPGVGVATFGSGCFWCTESDFDKVPGVLSTTSGYMGGTSPNPTYEQVSRGGTGHTEVLQVTYDTSKVSYGLLLEHFWKTTDVVDGGGQFCDRGHHYRPVIFTHDAEQARLAAEGKAALDASGKLAAPVAVEIAPAMAFGRAEAYHQDFYKTNPLRYLTYRAGCGRDARLDRLWGPGRLDHLKPKTQ